MFHIATKIRNRWSHLREARYIWASATPLYPCPELSSFCLTSVPNCLNIARNDGHRCNGSVTSQIFAAFPQLNFRRIHRNSINRGVNQQWQYQGQQQSQMQTPMGPQGQAQVHTQMFPQQGLQQQSHMQPTLGFQASNNAQIPQQQSQLPHLTNYQAPTHAQTIPPPMRDGALAIPA